MQGIYKECDSIILMAIIYLIIFNSFVPHNKDPYELKEDLKTQISKINCDSKLQAVTGCLPAG